MQAIKLYSYRLNYLTAEIIPLALVEFEFASHRHYFM